MMKFHKEKGPNITDTASPLDHQAHGIKEISDNELQDATGGVPGEHVYTVYKPGKGTLTTTNPYAVLRWMNS
jgi:hypothetical protein